MTYTVSPWSTLNQINRELNRFFDDRPPMASTLTRESHWTPSVDITEDPEAFRVLADLPGVKPEDMEISLHEGVLTLQGKRASETEATEGNYTRRERIRGSFRRQFNLPETANEETVTAKFNSGVLEIVIPKAEKRKPVSIQVEGE